MGENICNQLIDKGLISKLYKQLMQLNVKETNNPIKKQADLNRHSPKRTFQMVKNHMKRCLTWIIIREMQIKTAMGYYLILARMAIIKISSNNKCQIGCGEKGTFLSCWWEFSVAIGRTVWRFLKKLKIELPYDTETPLLGIYLEKNMVQKDTCTLMFIAALFATAKTWKQPRCPSTKE